MKFLTDEECDATPTPKIVIVQELRYAVLPRLSHVKKLRLWEGAA